MEKLIIEGGRELVGSIQISGAKNAALPLIAATLLAPGIHELTNVPDLRDTRTILALIGELGCTCRRQGSTLISTAAMSPIRRSPMTWSRPCGRQCSYLGLCWPDWAGQRFPCQAGAQLVRDR